MREALGNAWGWGFFEASENDFFDDVWIFEDGSEMVKIIWSNLFYGDDGETENRLTDPKNEDVLAWVKPLFWALLYHPAPRARPKKPTALAHDYTGLRTLLHWMSTRQIRYPHQLSQQEVEVYVAELPNLLLTDLVATDEFDVADGDDGEETTPGIGWSAFYKRLNLLDIIYSQSERFVSAGIKPMPETPFPDIGVKTLALRLASKLPGAIPPLQDEIAVPLFNNATLFVEEGLPFVERLIEYEQNNAPYELFFAETEKWNGQLCGRIFDEILSFEAARIRRPLEPEGQTVLEKLEHPSVRMHVLRALVRHYISACAILVHGLLGMRASEFLSIPRGIDAESGLPVCVRYEISSDGLFKIYLMDASLIKTAAGSEAATWTIGAVPVDSDELPIPVVALVQLNKVASLMNFVPNDPGRLFFTFCNNGLGCVTRWSVRSNIVSSRLAVYIKNSVRFFVNFDSLPDQSRSALCEDDLVAWKESSGELFRLHMLRKTFAQFIYHTDHSLIRGIQLQLQHQSLAMTYGYVSSGQQHAIKTAGDQILATAIMDTMYGQKPAGRQGRRLYEHIAEYQELVGRSKPAQAWLKVQKYNVENNIRLFSNGQHGYCLPLERNAMRCHEIAGTTSLAALQPNLAHRSPDVCSGCSCFLLMPNKSDFWIRRYQDNARAAAQLAAKSSQLPKGKNSLARNIFEQRARASAILLEQLGIDVKALSDQELCIDEKS